MTCDVALKQHDEGCVTHIAINRERIDMMLPAVRSTIDHY